MTSMRSWLRRAPRSLAPVVALLSLAGVCRAADPSATTAKPEVLQRISHFRQGLAMQSDQVAVRAVSFPHDPVRTYEKLEVSFAVDATYSNPFDPQQLDVTGLLRLPDGTQVTVPAFYVVPYVPANGVTQMEAYADYKAAGESGWRLRFAPPLPGAYSFRIQAVDALGRRAEAGPFTFSAVRSPRPGFVRVARDNPHYFENSADGSLFFGTGANVAWTRWGDPGDPLPCYEYYYRKARGQMTSTRVFMCHWAWLEWTPQVGDRPQSAWPGYGGAGCYNQMIATSVDRLLTLAEGQGLRVMVVTDTGDEWFPTPDAWGAHPYNAANGGPCVSPADMFTSPEARRLYRNRLRYIVARWGYSDSLWALDSWNNCQDPGPAELAWLREMRDYVHGLCRGWRPLIYGSNYRFAANTICDYAQTQLPLAADRPSVTQECYFTDDPAWFLPVLRRQLWEGLTGGLAAIMVWPHTLVDKTDAWQDFAPVAQAASRLPLNHGTWRPAKVEVAAAGLPPTALRVVEARPYGDVPDWGIKAPKNRFTLDLSQSAVWLEGFGTTLYGDRPGRAEWRNPPTLTVDLPAPGRLLVEVAEIGAGDQALTINVDGKLAAGHTFKGGRRELKEDEMWTDAPLTAGHHEIMLDNGAPSADWLHVRRVLLAIADNRAEAIVSVQALTDGREGVAYLRNSTNDQLYRRAGGGEPLTLTNVAVRLPGLKPGDCKVSWLNPATGKWSAPQTITCRNGVLTATLPELRGDAALLFTR